MDQFLQKVEDDIERIVRLRHVAIVILKDGTVLHLTQYQPKKRIGSRPLDSSLRVSSLPDCRVVLDRMDDATMQALSRPGPSEQKSETYIDYSEEIVFLHQKLINIEETLEDFKVQNRHDRKYHVEVVRDNEDLRAELIETQRQMKMKSRQQEKFIDKLVKNVIEHNLVISETESETDSEKAVQRLEIVGF